MAQYFLSLVKDVRYRLMKSVSFKKDKTTTPGHIIVKWLIILGGLPNALP